MKTWKLFAPLLLSASLPALAEPPPEVGRANFSCSLHIRHFNLVVDKHLTFIPGDVLVIQELGKEAVSAFLEPGEENLEISRSGVNLDIAANSCQLDKSGTQLVRCHYERSADRQGGARFSGLSFTHHELTPAGQRQVVSIGRSLDVKSLDVAVDVVPKADFRGEFSQRALAKVEITAEVAGGLRTLHYTRDLGEWTDATNRSDWDRCVMKP